MSITTVAVPVDISTDGPVRFRMSDGDIRIFPNYVIQDGEDGPTVSYTHGCIRVDLRFSHHATLQGIYEAIIDNERRFRR